MNQRSWVRLTICGNEVALWQSVDTVVKENLELVLQELMVNMSKHSKATQVHISFLTANGKLMVDYLDNGVGLLTENKPGKGLRNTVSRMDTLNGSIKFDNEANGLRITWKYQSV